MTFPAGAANRTNVNDLAPGLSLASISLFGGVYTLGGNGIVLTNSLTTSQFTNLINLPIDVQANAVTLNPNGGSMTIGGTLSGTGPITIYGYGFTQFTGTHTYSGTLTTACGVAGAGCGNLYLNGASMPSTSVINNFQLIGNGTVGALTSTNLFYPGADANGNRAVLNTGDLTLSGGGTVYMGLNGATAGTGYSQINVTGRVTISANTQLSLTLSGSFVPFLGQQFVLINNDGADPVIGAFAGKPEGTVITLNSAQFRLSYIGGDGNDVVLTSLNGIPLALVAVTSRKTHGSAGIFDLAIDVTQAIGGAVTVESRAIGTGHTIVFLFNGPVGGSGIASVIPMGSVTSTFIGSEVLVTLTNVPDKQRGTVLLTNVDGITPVQVSLGFLVGDVNNTLSVNSSDISGVKARSGQIATSLNFKFDVNASGAINASDISAVKARAGLVLP